MFPVNPNECDEATFQLLMSIFLFLSTLNITNFMSRLGRGLLEKYGPTERVYKLALPDTVNGYAEKPKVEIMGQFLVWIKSLMDDDDTSDLMIDRVREEINYRNGDLDEGTPHRKSIPSIDGFPPAAKKQKVTLPKVRFDAERLPQIATRGSVGYDVFMPQDYDLKPKESGWFSLGLRIVCMDKDYYLRLVPRSSTYDLGIVVREGIIDSDFLYKTIKVWIKNTLTYDYTIFKGESICQLILCPAFREKRYLKDVKRTGGIGSTNIVSCVSD
jgi:dUTPase